MVYLAVFIALGVLLAALKTQWVLALVCAVMAVAWVLLLPPAYDALPNLLVTLPALAALYVPSRAIFGEGEPDSVWVRAEAEVKLAWVGRVIGAVLMVGALAALTVLFIVMSESIIGALITGLFAVVVGVVFVPEVWADRVTLRRST